MAKGISNLLTAVLLIIIVVAISTVISNWLNSVSKAETGKLRNSASEQLGCQMADMYIKSAAYNCSGSCSAGIVHNLSVTVVNSGKRQLNISSVVIRNSTGNIISYGIGGARALSAGNELTINNASTASCTGINGSIEAVLVTSTNCPGNAYDEISADSELFRYADC